MVDREIDRIPDGSALELEDVLLDRLPHTTEVVILAVAGENPVPVLSTANNRPLDRQAWAAATADLGKSWELEQIALRLWPSATLIQGMNTAWFDTK